MRSYLFWLSRLLIASATILLTVGASLSGIPELRFLFVAPILGLCTGYIASKKGHAFYTWWLLGTLIFVVALPWALLLKSKSPPSQHLPSSDADEVGLGRASASNAWYYVDTGRPIGPITYRELQDVLIRLQPSEATNTPIWRKGLSNWTPAGTVIDLTDQPSVPPPLPSSGSHADLHVPMSLPAPASPPDNSRHSSVLGIVAIGLGVSSIIVPYFAAVFFAPAAIICAIIALMRGQRGTAIAGLLLGIAGIAGIFYTSYEISTALEKASKDLQEASRLLR
jgi:hypothetical protein